MLPNREMCKYEISDDHKASTDLCIVCEFDATVRFLAVKRIL